MRILLAQRLPCFRARTGDTRFTVGLLEALAERGHDCRMVALAGMSEGPLVRQELRRDLETSGIFPVRRSPDADVYVRHGVEFHVSGDGRQFLTRLSNQIREFEPSVIIASEDRTYLTLMTALQEAGRVPVLFLSCSQATLPFGPECLMPDAAKTAVLRRASRIVAPNRYIRDYISRWSNLPADTLPIPSFGRGPFPCFARCDQGFITLVNPSAIKGLCIFERLARMRPNLAFAAVPTWATTSSDRDLLERLPNVTLLPSTDDVDEIFRLTRVLLVPSLWGEAVGRVVIEAMLRGIPVLASNVGGLPESKLGIDYVLPVRPIERYLNRMNERDLPVPLVPDQDVAPWLEALDRLLSCPEHYHELSIASRAAAAAYVSGLNVAPFERFLQDLESAGQHQ